MKTELWADNVFEIKAIELCSNLNFNSIILSLDPLDDYFLPLTECIELIKFANSKMLNVKIKLFNTSFEAIEVLTQSFTDLNFDIILSDVKVLNKVSETLNSCYLFSSTKEIPFLNNSNFKGYIFKQSDHIISSNQYTIGYYDNNEDVEFSADFKVVPFSQFQISYRQIDYDNLEKYLKKRL